MWFLKFVAWVALLVTLSYQLMANALGPITLDNNNRPVIVSFGSAYEASSRSELNGDQKQKNSIDFVRRMQNLNSALEKRNLFDKFRTRFLFLMIVALVTSIQAFRFDVVFCEQGRKFYWFGYGMLWWFWVTLFLTVVVLMHDYYSLGMYETDIRGVLFTDP